MVIVRDVDRALEPRVRLAVFLADGDRETHHAVAAGLERAIVRLRSIVSLCRNTSPPILKRHVLRTMRVSCGSEDAHREAAAIPRHATRVRDTSTVVVGEDRNVASRALVIEACRR
jgi:hypothetical protein